MPIYTWIHLPSLFSLPSKVFLHSHLVNFALRNPAQRQLLWRPFSLLSVPYRQNLLFFLWFCLILISLCCVYSVFPLHSEFSEGKKWCDGKMWCFMNIQYFPQILNWSAGFANAIIFKTPSVNEYYQSCYIFLLSFYMVHFGVRGPEFYIIPSLWCR